MITSLRETKTRLSEFVQLAQKGEDIIITVHGKPKARLTAIQDPQALDRKAWADELLKLQRNYTKMDDSAVSIVNDLRKERF